MKIASITLGCKVNQYETQAMEAELRKRGHEICSKNEHPDVYIINTCAVTAESGRKSRQVIRRVLAADPQALVAVCGCFSQLSPEETKALGAHLVSGSGERMKFVDELERMFTERGQLLLHDDPMQRNSFEPLIAGSVHGRTRAMLKIEDGCENFCAYCIIPYVRGPIRSLSAEKAISEAKRLREEGYSELVITGIEITSYRDAEQNLGLAQLVAKIAQAVPDIRLRLGSLYPSAIDEEFCKSLPRHGLCEHFHLSVQSGCSATLERMNRKYDAKTLIEAAERLRKYFPNCAFTADIITGFPGETEEEFLESMNTVKRIGFASMHVFPYSIRPGTVAESLDNQIPEHVKTERAAHMRNLEQQMKKEYLQSCIGKKMKVLLETEKNGESFGHAENYCAVSVKGGGKRGDIVTVHISEVLGDQLVGNIES